MDDMMAPPGAKTPPGTTEARAVSAAPTLVAFAALGGAVALTLGAYGQVHNPTGGTIISFGFPTVLSMKAWFATFAASLAIVQLLSALWMYGKLPIGSAPSWIGVAHRWTGTAAFLFSLPVAYHCLWALGFQTTGTRQLVHSILGCAFYGAITTKLLVLRAKDMPGWALPAVGGTLFTLLSLLWMTSSLWFFTNVGFPGV
ncbi:MAG: DUF6529 family protein [Actinomycetota bacterium]|nr:DUF6529 family protein [Actinomycetota bacterium]